MNTLDQQLLWWKNATIYQIYPKSFRSSHQRTTGDIKGIVDSLDYLKILGIDAIWLTPIYQSPMVDNGYDISDYYSINSEFGDMADVEQLIMIAHQKGIRIIMDIVVNHTSTEHHWFQSALGDKDSQYRDYYIWKDPIDGKAPNNWVSKFGGNAWALDPATDQYYLHLFATQQADLNWENSKVRQEVKEVISFWAEKGIDGFRLDVINLISKDQQFPNDDEGDGRRFYTDGPKVHQYLQEISHDVFEKYGSVTVGEMSSTTLEHCQQYSAPSGDELSMVFNFHHLKVDYPNGEKWSHSQFDFIQLKQILGYWQTGLHQNGWGALFWCNHDQPRIVSRLGNDQQYRIESAKMLAAALHMLQGTPYIYQGEEIGMTNPHFEHLSQYRDVESTNMFDIMVNQQGVPASDMLAILQQKSRDNSRTPMQWDATEYAGFSTVKPWIDVADNYHSINVQQALKDNNSVFYFYQQLIELRKNTRVITDGEFTDLAPEHPSVFCYQRKNDDQHLVCLCNFYEHEIEFELETEFDFSSCRVLIANYPCEKPNDRKFALKPYEVKVIIAKG